MSLWEIYKAKRLGYADDLWTSLIGHQLGGYSWQSDYETTPYLYRAMPNLSHYYNREIMEEVVGGSVGWNQLADGSDADYLGNYATVSYSSADNEFLITFNVADAGVGLYNASAYDGIPSGHKCLISCSAKASGSIKFRFYLNNASSGYTQTPTTRYKQFATILNTSTANQFDVFARDTTIDGTMTVKDLQLIDLTLALGSTIADYVYSLEQATAGSGVAWLKEHFPKMFGQFNAYDAGSIQSVSGLVSHDTVGKNLFDPNSTDHEWVTVGGDISTTRTEVKSMRINVLGMSNLTASMSNNASDTNILLIALFASDMSLVSRNVITSGKSLTKAIPTNAVTAIVSFFTYSEAGNVQVELGSTATAYEPYHRNSYPLDSTLTLRGIPKLDNGKLYYDGDVYEPDGTVTRKYGIRAYQSGDESLADAVTDGTNTVYKLATPTTETAQPFTKTQLCDSGGTEEFVTSGIVSVGHKSKYAEK